MKRYPLFLILLISLLFSDYSQAQKYYVYVAAESEDEVALVSFDGEQAKVETRIPVGIYPTEIEGPHGLAVSPDGKYWFLSMAHGNPFGTLYKFSTATNQIVGQTTLGLFPATMQISKRTGLLYVVNFNLHGDMVPSTVSVVEPNNMLELKRVETGVMPHGSRISPDGAWHYSLAMMSGELFEIDAAQMTLHRTLDLDEAVAKAEKQQMAGHAAMAHEGMDHSNMNHEEMDQSKMNHEGMDHGEMKHSKVKPTWVIPHPTEKKVYVAGNGSDELLEIDLQEWAITRRFKTGKGPYNVEVTPDGSKMLSTYKSEGTTGIWDLASGKELARIPNTRKVCHGIAITPDSKYAFVSVEGIGGDPGTVDIIDLEKLEKVAFAEIGKQAGGIVFWKME